MLPPGEAMRESRSPSSGTGLSAAARGVLALMGSGMRLVVAHENGKLIADPRIPYLTAGDSPALDVSAEIVAEVQQYGWYSGPRDAMVWQPAISEVAGNTIRFKDGCKVGWREMFAGHLDLIPEGAQVYAVTQ